MAHLNNSANADGLWYNVQQWDGDPLSSRTSAIHAIDIDESTSQLIVDLGGDTTYPRPSSDGQWLYFQSNADGGRYSVYRSRTDGSEISKLSHLAQLGPQWAGAEAFGVALSGDGGSIVYTLHDGTVGKAVVANADGSGAQFVAPDLDYTYMAGLNENGGQIVFSGPASDYRLLSVTAPGSTPQTLTPLHPNSYVPQFTPDGNTVVFVRGDGDLYSVPAGGGDVQPLTNGNGYFSFHWSDLDTHGSSDGPDISPDGTRIAYVGLVGGVPQVHTMNLDGTGAEQVTFGSTAAGRVRWSPDGTQLAFLLIVENYAQLFVMQADGSNVMQLTNLVDSGVSWVEWQVAVPEPNSCAILLGGSLMLGRQARRIRSIR